MQISEEVTYRLRLAEGFLDEARQDIGLSRWRSCIDNSQLSVENAAKAVLAMLAPVGRTHNPAILLRKVLAEGRFPEAVRGEVEEVAECSELLGQDIHMETDYGSETEWRTPWELFDESDGREALATAERACNLVRQISAAVTAPPESDVDTTEPL
jgi:HEPN domain-containing protein